MQGRHRGGVVMVLGLLGACQGSSGGDGEGDGATQGESSGSEGGADSTGGTGDGGPVPVDCEAGSRRSVLGMLAAAGVASPLALALGRGAMAAAGDIKAMFVYIPDGCIPSLWHPTGGPTGFTLPTMTAPLEPVRDDLVFIRGLDMYAGGATHEGGIAKILTGNGDVSLDVFPGDALGKGTPHKSIQLGVATNFKNGSGSWPFIGAGQQVSPQDNPLSAFDSIFGALDEPEEPGPDWVRLRAGSVIDSAIDDVKRRCRRVARQTSRVRPTDDTDSASAGLGGMRAPRAAAGRCAIASSQRCRLGRPSMSSPDHA